MMQNETYNDDVLLDRLVDGELTGNERRRLLESFDAQPEAWRRCALAFLETQSWREELGQVARGVQSETNAATSPASSVRSSRTTQWAARVQWLALAASLALAFGLGWMQRRHAVPIADVAPPINAVSPSGGKVGDALTFYVRDDAGKMQPVRVPLVDAGTLDDQLGVKFQTGLPDTMRDQLKNRGYTVQSKRQYAPLWLENGRPMIVPVEDTKIVPVGNRVY